MKIDHEARAALEALIRNHRTRDVPTYMLRWLLLRMESEPNCDCPDCEDRTRKTGLASRMHWYDPFG